jgi:hypothetical protein
MKVSIALGAAAAVAALLAAVPAFADCSYPAAPEHLPDGNTATMPEMVEGQKAVKAYNDSMNAYLNCLKLEHDDAVGKLTPTAGAKDDEKKAAEDRKKAMDAIEIQKHNAAIDALQQVADRFNEQVRVFKKKAADAGDKKKG